MAYFSWSEDLRTGDAFIDGDRRKLIGLADPLRDAMLPASVIRKAAA